MAAFRPGDVAGSGAGRSPQVRETLLQWHDGDHSRTEPDAHAPRNFGRSCELEASETSMTETADMKERLEGLEMERACALRSGLGTNRLYMTALEGEIEAVRAAYVGSAVIEIACLRARVGAPTRG
jgi:hypothetical protein